MEQSTYFIHGPRQFLFTKCDLGKAKFFLFLDKVIALVCPEVPEAAVYSCAAGIAEGIYTKVSRGKQDVLKQTFPVWGKRVPTNILGL